MNWNLLFFFKNDTPRPSDPLTPRNPSGEAPPGQKPSGDWTFLPTILRNVSGDAPPGHKLSGVRGPFFLEIDIRSQRGIFGVKFLSGEFPAVKIFSAGSNSAGHLEGVCNFFIALLVLFAIVWGWLFYLLLPTDRFGWGSIVLRSSLDGYCTRKKQANL